VWVLAGERKVFSLAVLWILFDIICINFEVLKQSIAMGDDGIHDYLGAVKTGVRLFFACVDRGFRAHPFDSFEFHAPIACD
jgi:hypothetical protein